MKHVFTGILLTSMGFGIVSCSSPSTAPGADSSVAAPAGNGDAFSFDIATSTIAIGKIRLAKLHGRKLAPGWALDENGKSSAGDKFEASLAAPLVVDGTTLLGKGTRFHGRVVAAEGSGRVKGLANISLVLTDFVHDGKTTPITTKNWAMEAKSTKKNDAAKIGIGAGIGTAIGAIAGGGSGADAGGGLSGAA